MDGVRSLRGKEYPITRMFILSERGADAVPGELSIPLAAATQGRAVDGPPRAAGFNYHFPIGKIARAGRVLFGAEAPNRTVITGRGLDDD